MHKKNKTISTLLIRLLGLSLLLPLTITSLTLSGCSQEKPITLGFVGGLSGRVSDLGGPARNGMLLAVEEINNQGGIHGAPVATLIKDDKQDAEVAVIVVKELIDQEVDAIIGPVTSSMAVNVAPLASEAKTVMMGVTVTTNNLTGMDDYFFRTISATATHAGKMAEYLYQNKNIRSFSAIYDLKNEAYSFSWLNDFKTKMESLGGTSKSILNFTSGKQEKLIPLSQELLKDEPDIVIFITNSVDAALLAKLVRAINPQIPIATSEWAGTERLIALGGSHVEGALVPQYLDRESKQAIYVDFRDRYIKRFKQEPGFPGMIAYNATNVVLDRLKKKESNQSLKDAILAQKNYPGIQEPIKLDPFGDGKSKTYITKVINGRFIVQTP